MGDMGLKIYHDISGIYCDNDINDDNSGNPVSLEKSIIFPVFTPNRVLWALPSTHVMQWLFNSYWTPEGALAQKFHKFTKKSNTTDDAPWRYPVIAE